jgi:surface antigen
MSFMDSKKKSDTLDANKSSLRIPGLVTEQSPADQLPFPDSQAQASGADRFTPFDFFESDKPTTTGPITSPEQSSGPITNPELQQSLIIPPAVTQQLAQTGALKPLEEQQQPEKKVATRQPVVIRGTGTKSTGALPPSLKRSRLVTHASVAAFLLFVVVGTLLIVAPMSDAQMGLGIFKPQGNSVSSASKNYSLLAQQAATATAVLTDGRDIGQNTNNPANPDYNPYLPVEPGNMGGDGSWNRFYYGQCTWWAAYRYYQLTGINVAWTGDAYAWPAGASANGWDVSTQPHVPSIIALPPGDQGAGAYGHVAIVESINSDGSLNVSTWNWGANPGAVTSYITLQADGYASFIWYPTK